MKILVHSYAFYPSIGGIETVSEILSQELVRMGYEVTVVTAIPDKESNGLKFPFPVIRQPSFFHKIRLVKNVDIVCCNGASLSFFFFAKMLNKPFVWIHGGYQVSSIDGLGWYKGRKAPVGVWKSIKFHFKYNRILPALTGSLKLLLRRIVAEYGVSANVAITDWMLYRQPLKKQIRIYNPFPLTRFSNARMVPCQYEFIYVGRLVSEKGIMTLLKAFRLLKTKYPFITLAVVGEGYMKSSLDEFIINNELVSNVFFMGKKQGQELIDVIEKASIAIVPSEWEEPMGGVALELMAAGKNIIVSENGGLAECVGRAGLTFKNGDYHDLENKMEVLLNDEILRKEQREIAKEHIKSFSEEESVSGYVALFRRLVYKKGFPDR